VWVGRGSALEVWFLRSRKPPPRPSPKGRELYSMQDASHRQSVDYGQKSTSHKLRATGLISASPMGGGGGEAAGGGLLGGVWEVGSGLWVGRESASGFWFMQPPQPPPRPSPKGRELYLMRTASRGRCVVYMDTSHGPLSKSPALPEKGGVAFAVTKPWIIGAAWAPARGRSAPLAGDSSSPFQRLVTDSPDEAGHAGRDPGSMP